MTICPYDRAHDLFVTAKTKIVWKQKFGKDASEASNVTHNTRARHPATRRHASLARSCPRPSRRRWRSRHFRPDFSGVSPRASHDGDVAPDDFLPAAFRAPSRARGDGRAAAALGRVGAGGWRRYRGCGQRDCVDEPRPGRPERREGGASPIRHPGRQGGHRAARSRSRRGAIEPRRAPRVPGVRHQTQGRGPHVLPQPRTGRTVPRGDAKVRARHAPRTRHRRRHRLRARLRARRWRARPPWCSRRFPRRR